MRDLYLKIAFTPSPSPPSPAEQIQRIADLRNFARWNQKNAEMLTESELPEEAGPHQKAANQAPTEAGAVEGSAA